MVMDEDIWKISMMVQVKQETDNDGKIDTETISTAFIGYAPTVNPKMTITVTSPNSSNPNTGVDYASLVTMRITKAVSSKFFELYPL